MKVWMKILGNVGGILTVCFLVISYISLFEENRRLADNFEAFAKGTKYDQMDSLNVARSERLLLDNSEIKSYFPEINRHIANMEIKLRQLERYSMVNTIADYQIVSRLKDTVKIRETVIQDRIVRDTVKLQYITYKDKWIDFQQAIVADSAYTAIQTRDSIAIVQSWERPHKFWFIRYGRKRHIQTVSNANPNAKITYSIYVEKK